ncbi:fringe glycosyltransferase-like [Contarinia nasturtii]|uniref:fringe glycosyltransferase-like n=1 Tax=Contarinia nasturtii TaxID=265458 RepID=UPI0012D3DD5D|nr:fringe glycosyltransferase-like [Contarinia nasturtii]
MLIGDDCLRFVSDLLFRDFRLQRTTKIMAIIGIIIYAAAILCRISYGHPNYNKALDAPKSPSSMGDLLGFHRNLTPTQLPWLNEVTTNQFDSSHRMTIDAGTVTPKPTAIQLHDVFLAVKTTQTNHAKRLNIISKTWFQMAREQTWFFTDANDDFYNMRLNKHLINTKCPKGHSRRALCCKMAAELITFLEHRKKWFCHFDDDNYVNIAQLQLLLSEYDSSSLWYLGKPSVASPLEVKLSETTDHRAQFWFATGGAGFCISRPLVQKMAPVIRNEKLMTISDRIGFPDDVTIGFIIEYLLKVPLTVIDEFHSHLEPLDQIPPQTFRKQISYSYAFENNAKNVVKVDGFNERTDPTRFLSLHCHLFPQQNSCSLKKHSGFVQKKSPLTK